MIAKKQPTLRRWVKGTRSGFRFPQLLSASALSALVVFGLAGIAGASGQPTIAQREAAARPTPPAAGVLTGPARAAAFAPPVNTPGGGHGLPGGGSSDMSGSLTAADLASMAALSQAGFAGGPLGIPEIVLRAYKLAADRVNAESPGCDIPWALLAGIGKVESNHAGNGAVDSSGRTLVPIRGPVLDGTLPGNEVITLSDAGGATGGPQYASAEGPMQFLPGTWARWGADGNGDGKADVDNVFDATLSAGRYLCSGVTGGIMNNGNQIRAVLRYNNSMQYVGLVLSYAAAYAAGVTPTVPVIDLRTVSGDGVDGYADPGAAGGAPDPADRTSATSTNKDKKNKDSTKKDSRKPGSPSTPGGPSTPSGVPPSTLCLVVCFPVPSISIPPLPTLPTQLLPQRQPAPPATPCPTPPPPTTRTPKKPVTCTPTPSTPSTPPPAGAPATTTPKPAPSKRVTPPPAAPAAPTTSPVPTPHR